MTTTPNGRVSRREAVNFADGAQYMLGPFVAWSLLSYPGLGYCLALIIAPTAVACFGMVMERLLLRQLQNLDHLYGLLGAYAVALIEGLGGLTVTARWSPAR